MKSILILGSGGQLGTALVRLLTAQNKPFVALDHPDIDLSHPEDLKLPLGEASVVFNCSAYTNVDGAESDEVTAQRVNGDAVGVIARACKEAGLCLVHFSTDYVFDGTDTAPIDVGHPRAPLGAYGRSKARGEELLEQSGAEFLLVRTSWVYAPWGNNFVKTMVRLFGEKEEVRVVNDQRGRPTHAVNLAERSLALFERGERGIFHVTDGGQCSWFEFASAIARQTGTKCRVLSCTTAEFPRPAPRPAYGVLATSKADELLGPAAPFEAWLERMLAGS